MKLSIKHHLKNKNALRCYFWPTHFKWAIFVTLSAPNTGQFLTLGYSLQDCHFCILKAAVMVVKGHGSCREVRDRDTVRALR